MSWIKRLIKKKSSNKHNGAIPLQDDNVLAFFEFNAMCLLQTRIDERLIEEIDQGEIDDRNYMFVRSIITEEIKRYAHERGILNKNQHKEVEQ